MTTRSFDDLIDETWGKPGSPERERHDADLRALERRQERAVRLTSWMRALPLGPVMETFWYGILGEGVRATVKPRWGLMTWSFLNDGHRPTLWFLWQCAVGREPYATTLYPSGAPRNAAEAGE
jgi:hypothetical protein